MSRVLAYARLVRLPNVFTAIADVGIGPLVAGTTSQWPLLAVSSACLYSAGMVWNDYFDRQVDAIERPFRPIPSGQITPRSAAQLAVVLSVAGVSVAIWLGSITGFHAVALLALILAYDGGLKSTAIGPLAMGACRFTNVLLGCSVATEAILPWSTRLILAGIVGLYVVGITVMAKDEVGGARRLRLQIGAALLGIALVAALVAGGHASSLGVYVLMALTLVLGSAVIAAVSRPDPKTIQRAIKTAILGLIALDAALAAGAVGVPGLVLLTLLVPAVVLGRWVYST